MTVTAPRQCARYGVCNGPRLIRGAQDELLGRPLISPAVQCKGDSIIRPAGSILDASFCYVPSFSTSVASTWRRAGWQPTTEEQRTAQQRSGPSTSTRAALYLVCARASGDQIERGASQWALFLPLIRRRCDLPVPYTLP